MRIAVKGLNVEVTDELREHVEKRFEKVDRMVSELATLRRDPLGGAQPGLAEPHKAEANLSSRACSSTPRSTPATCAPRSPRSPRRSAAR